MNKYTVYCHTNLSNGKKYFGITFRDPEKRWINGKGYKNNAYFSRAIEKYGWNGFSHEIIYSGLTKEQAETTEINLISKYKSNDHRYGYNIENGGNSADKFTPEIREKISQALVGHICSEKTKKKISISNSGRRSSRKGIKATSDQIEKNRQSHLGQTPWNLGREWTKEEKAKCGGKAVKCVETGQVYLSAHEASYVLGIDFSSICKCRRGKVKTAGGYHWIEVTVNG